MNKYEGLFILNTAGKEEGVKEAIDKITAEITQAGGKVDTVQKMDKRTFTRVARKVSSGFYVNVIFEGAPSIIAPLRTRFGLSEDVFQVLFTHAGPQAPERTPPIPQA